MRKELFGPCRHTPSELRSAAELQSNAAGGPRNKSTEAEEERERIIFFFKEENHSPGGVVTRGLLGFFEANPGVIAPFVLFI